MKIDPKFDFKNGQYQSYIVLINRISHLFCIVLARYGKWPLYRLNGLVKMSVFGSINYWFQSGSIYRQDFVFNYLTNNFALSVNFFENEYNYLFSFLANLSFCTNIDSKSSNNTYLNIIEMLFFPVVGTLNSKI